MATSSLKRSYIMENSDQAQTFIDAYDEAMKKPIEKYNSLFHQLKGNELDDFIKGIMENVK